jgi:tetratricopeptide (TPR) repeat protein
MYDNLMNKYSFSGMNKKEKYFLDDKAVIVPSNVQNLFISTAGHYLGKVDEIKFYDSTLSIPENKEKVALYKSRALNLIDKCLKEMPENVLITRGNTKYSIAFIYYELGEMQKAEKHLSELYEMSKKEVNYYLKYSGSSHKSYNLRLMTKDAFDTMERCAATAKQWNMESLANKMEKGNKEVTNAVSTFINND